MNEAQFVARSAPWKALACPQNYFGLVFTGAFVFVVADAVLNCISLVVALCVKFSVITDIRADLLFVVFSSQNVLQGPSGSLNTAPHPVLQVIVQLA
jgi:hypothetical protein